MQGAMQHKREWRPVTAAEYDELLEAACAEIERLRDDVRAYYRGHGEWVSAPRLADELRELRAAVSALRSGPGWSGFGQ